MSLAERTYVTMPRRNLNPNRDDKTWLEETDFDLEAIRKLSRLLKNKVVRHPSSWGPPTHRQPHLSPAADNFSPSPISPIIPEESQPVLVTEVGITNDLNGPALLPFQFNNHQQDSLPAAAPVPIPMEHLPVLPGEQGQEQETTAATGPAHIDPYIDPQLWQLQTAPVPQPLVPQTYPEIEVIMLGPARQPRRLWRAMIVQSLNFSFISSSVALALGCQVCPCRPGFGQTDAAYTGFVPQIMALDICLESGGNQIQIDGFIIHDADWAAAPIVLGAPILARIFGPLNGAYL